MCSTLGFIRPMQSEQGWTDATAKIAAREFEVIEADPGNDNIWKARKSMNPIPTFPPPQYHGDE
jgi:hypothetical protein